MTDPNPVALNEFNDLIRMLRANAVYQQILSVESLDDDCLCMGTYSCTNRSTPPAETKMSLLEHIELTRMQIQDLQEQLEEAEQELATESEHPAGE